MAKFVIGNTKIKGIPAIVRDLSPVHYIEKTVDANGVLQNTTNIINLTGVTDIKENVLAYQYSGLAFPANTHLDLSGITSITYPGACRNMFASTTGIVSVDLSGLTTVGANDSLINMFASSANLTTVNLSNLTSITNTSSISSMFYGCVALTNIDLSNLTTVATLNSFLVGCTSLKSISFPKLNVITSYLGTGYQEPFRNCSKLEDIYLGGVTASTFSTTGKIGVIFNNTTGSEAPNGCTLHFPSNFDPDDPAHTFDITTLSNYPLFGGSANYIHLAFDLPATE